MTQLFKFLEITTYKKEMLDQFILFAKCTSKLQILFRIKQKRDRDIYEQDIKLRYTVYMSNLKENQGMKALSKKTASKNKGKKADKKNAAKKDLKKKLADMSQEQVDECTNNMAICTLNFFKNLH